MIKNITIELEVMPIDQLVLAEKSQWIWARDCTKDWSEWERIRVWKADRFGRADTFGSPNLQPMWSTDSSDIKYTENGTPPYTHYVILPDIKIYD